MLCGPTNPTTCNLCVSANQTLPPVFEKPKTRLAQIRGYQVRRGEKGTQVQYWRFDEERKINDSNGRPVIDVNGEPRTEKVRLERPQVFIAYVFNAEQIDGVPQAPSRECSWNPLEKAQQLIQAANPKLEHASGDRAYYRPSTDSIHLPLKEQFPSAGDYYSTLLHELGHWTGHATRLNRDLSDPFGQSGTLEKSCARRLRA
jgi:putative DNA primase/helicase